MTEKDPTWADGAMDVSDASEPSGDAGCVPKDFPERLQRPEGRFPGNPYPTDKENREMGASTAESHGLAIPEGVPLWETKTLDEEQPSGALSDGRTSVECSVGAEAGAPWSDRSLLERPIFLPRPPRVDFYVVATAGKQHFIAQAAERERGTRAEALGVWKKTRRGFTYPSAAFSSDGGSATEPTGLNFGGMAPSSTPASLQLVWVDPQWQTDPSRVLSTAELYAEQARGDICFGCGCTTHAQTHCPLRKCGKCSAYGHAEKACSLFRYAEAGGDRRFDVGPRNNNPSSQNVGGPFHGNPSLGNSTGGSFHGNPAGPRGGFQERSNSFHYKRQGNVGSSGFQSARPAEHSFAAAGRDSRRHYPSNPPPQDRGHPSAFSTDWRTRAPTDGGRFPSESNQRRRYQ